MYALQLFALNMQCFWIYCLRCNSLLFSWTLLHAEIRLVYKIQMGIGASNYDRFIIKIVPS